MAFSLNGLYNMTYGSSITECPHWLLLQMCVCGFLLATVVLFQASCQMNYQCIYTVYFYGFKTVKSMGKNLSLFYTVKPHRS